MLFRNIDCFGWVWVRLPTDVRELKYPTFSRGRRQPEVKFTSGPRFPPTWAILISSGINLSCMRASSLFGGYCEKSRARASGNREEKQERGAGERKESLQRSLIFFLTWKPQETAKRENFRRKQEMCQPPVSVSYADSLRTNYYTTAQRQDFFLLFLRP